MLPEQQHNAVRSKDFRYIHYANGAEELYDHRKDPLAHVPHDGCRGLRPPHLGLVAGIRREGAGRRANAAGI